MKTWRKLTSGPTGCGRASRSARRAVVLVIAAIELLAIGGPTAAWPASPVRVQVEAIIARMRGALDQAQMLALDISTLDRFVTDADRSILATRYWSFRANVPVTVSIMRHVEQSPAPFWLAARGFARTDLRVRNEEYQYEVWRKDFAAGPIGLGINGFDKHREHYFVCVGPQASGSTVRLTEFSPPGQQQYVMRKGATIYHDWPDLVLTEVPAALSGQILLPTIRGRAREAHLIGGFRTTQYPASDKPDQVMLTWCGDPRTTQAIQWRAASSVREGAVQWRRLGNVQSPWRITRASGSNLTDPRILNNPSVRRFTAVLTGLSPGTVYEYAVGTVSTRGGRLQSASSVARFRTAPAYGKPFSFVWLSDTHNRPDTAPLLAHARKRLPNTAFCAISGDLVGTGQQRDDWDQLFEHASGFMTDRPIVPSMGNHDTIDGLGAELYVRQFALPRNGAPGLEQERSYSFTYSNALFVVLDCTGDVAAQGPWLERLLRSSRATWKFAIFHFPPYSLEEDYPDIRAAWCRLFDRYGVDLVLNGHVHHLQRTKPIRAGKPVAGAGRAPIYLMTVSVGQGRTIEQVPGFADVAAEPGPPLYHSFEVSGRCLEMRAQDATGKVWDRLTLRK